MITLSLGVCENKRAGVKRAFEGWRRVWDAIKEEGDGAIASLEFGAQNGSIHIHVLHYGKFQDRDRLIELWKGKTGAWYVDVRAIKGGKKAIKEVAKYITSKLDDVQFADEVEGAISGLRVFRTYGIFYNKVLLKDDSAGLCCPFCGGREFEFERREQEEWLALLIKSPPLYVGSVAWFKGI